MTEHIEINSELPIGVFDSGMGGLTVLRQLQNQLPNESFLYLGDTARLPYGTKSRHTVVQYAKQMAQLLIAKGIKALVIACNTATTAALETLQTLYPHIPVIGVIEPGARAALKASKNQDILVLATETTVRSQVYKQTLQTLTAEIKVKELACGLFVALAEEACTDDEVAQSVVKKYLADAKRSNSDCILLGCTHFPVLKQTIQAYIGQQVTIVDSAIETANVVKQMLKESGLTTINKMGNTLYLVTDLPERFIRIGQTFLQQQILASEVEVVDGV